MKKFLLITVALILIIVISVAVLVRYLRDESLLRDDFNYRNYGIRYDDVEFTVTPINATIASGNNIAAILHLLEVAEANLIAANYLASASIGDGTANSSFPKMSGGLQFGDIYVRDNGAFYSQNVARVTETDPSQYLVLTQILLDQADRKYSADGQTFFVQKVGGNKATARMINAYPFGSADFAEGSLETFTLNEYKTAEYIRSNVSELSNFVFTEDTILADSVNIIYTNGLYIFTFDVNLVDEVSRNDATKYARANMRKASSSNDLEYGLFRVTIEMFDNGLISKYTKEESWVATLNIGPIKPNGSSHSITSKYYSWDPADCTFSGNGIDISWAN